MPPFWSADASLDTFFKAVNKFMRCGIAKWGMEKPRQMPKSCYVYLLKSCDDGPSKSYVGWTTDLEKRLAAHNNGSGARPRGDANGGLCLEVFKTRGAPCRGNMN